MELRDIVAMNVKRLRKEAGVTQEELALRVGVGRTLVGGIERGENNSTMNTLQKVAAALEVDPLELFREEGTVSGIPESVFAPIDDADGGVSFVLCSWDGDEYGFRRIDVRNGVLASVVLTALLAKGYRDEELASRYKKIEWFMDYLITEPSVDERELDRLSARVAVRPANRAGSRKGAPDTGAAKTAKVARTAKAARTAKTASTAKAAKTAKDAKGAQGAKGAKGARSAQGAQAAKDAKGAKAAGAAAGTVDAPAEDAARRRKGGGGE